jgi:hypothetical protein
VIAELAEAAAWMVLVFAVMRPPLTVGMIAPTVWADRAHSVAPTVWARTPTVRAVLPHTVGVFPHSVRGFPHSVTHAPLTVWGEFAHSVMTLTWSVTLGWYLRPS